MLRRMAPQPYQPYQVGQPWPHPIASDELQAVMDVGEESLNLMLVAAVERPTAAEWRALARGQTHIGILPSDPLVWFILATERISLNAPYGLGLTGSERAEKLRAAASHARSWPDTECGLVTVAVIDTASRLIAELRARSLSRTWWIALADALAAMPTSLDQSAYNRAIARDYGRWTTPAAMLAACTIIETGGTCLIS